MKHDLLETGVHELKFLAAFHYGSILRAADGNEVAAFRIMIDRPVDQRPFDYNAVAWDDETRRAFLAGEIDIQTVLDQAEGQKYEVSVTTDRDRFEAKKVSVLCERASFGEMHVDDTGLDADWFLAQDDEPTPRQADDDADMSVGPQPFGPSA